MRNQRAFTIVELVIVITILAIFLALFIPTFMKSARGMELGKYYPADDANIATIASAMRTDLEQTVVIVLYAKNWDGDTADALVDEAAEVAAKFVKLGIANIRVHHYLFGNKGGFELDGKALPLADGVWLSLP